MSEPIHFPCPACREPLRVPAAAAGQQGPCPSCGVEIIGPASDLPARLAEVDHFAPFPGLGVRTPDDTGAGQPAEPSPPPEREPAPFSGFTPPEPGADEPDRDAPPPPGEPPPAPGSRGLPPVALLLVGMLGVLCAFAGGYFLGWKHQPLPGPFFASPSSDAPSPDPGPPASARNDAPGEPVDETPLAEMPAPLAETEPVEPLSQPDRPSPEPSGQSSRETLVAFLEAPDWEARREYVLDPGATGPKMMRAAEAGDDGPLGFLTIESELLDAAMHHYRVKTETLPQGFPVTLHRTEDGWAIHWPTFDEFSRDKLARFAAGKLGESGRFHVFVREESTDSPHFALFRVRAPIAGRDYPAFVKRERALYGELITALDTGSRSETYAQVVAERGVPVVLDLSYRRNAEDQPYLVIERLVALSWNDR